MKILISPSQVEEIQEIIELELESGLTSWSALDYERELGDPHIIMLKARQQGQDELIGFFSGRVIGDEFEIMSLAVKNAFRRKGVASGLLQVGLDIIRERKIIQCWLEVRALNFSAIKLYEKFGFQAVGLRKMYYQQPPDDALIMMCLIPPLN